MTGWARTRSLFPVVDQGIVYLNHAAMAPPSARVTEALARHGAEATRRGASRYAAFFEAEIDRVRGRVARLLGARAEEIAFVKNTTEGLGLVAAGLDWRAGDRVVTCDLEYPSNVYPWWRLERRGVETVMLASEGGRLPVDRVDEALRHPSVRLLALSSVEYANGLRHDLPVLGALCRERGVLFCVDAIQGLGALAMDVEACGIDFLAAGGHKWLCSVEGCGVFYCARRVLDRVEPLVVGWRSVRDRDDTDRYHLELPATAARFEEGTPNTAGIFALGAAVDLILELGPAQVEARVLALSDHLAAGLARCGASLRSPRGPGERSPIVSFRWPGEAPEATVDRLRERRIVTAARRGGVRVSPHFYNDESDLDALLGALSVSGGPGHPHA